MFRRALIAFVVAAAIALAPTGASARGGFGGGGFHGSGFHGGFAKQHDGYRLIVHREGKRVRLLTRRGYDWSSWQPTGGRRGSPPPPRPRFGCARCTSSSTARPWCSVLTGSPISRACIVEGATRMSGCTPSISQPTTVLDMRDETLQIRKLWLASC